MKEEKSEFLKQVSELTEQLNQLIKDSEGKSLIVIATDSEDGEKEVKEFISVNGNASRLAESLSVFATKEKTVEIFERAVKLASLKMISGILKNVMESERDSVKQSKK